MNRLRIMIAVLLAALWLPATQHCGLEAAGLLADQCGDGRGPTDCVANGNCANDDCGTLEGGDYRSDVAPLKLSSPQWFTCVFLLSEAIAATPAEPDSAPTAGDALDRPREWVPGWQFERRAAAPAHAPDTLIA